MGWCIGRTEEGHLMPCAAIAFVPILIDAILMAESYRGARHQVTFLDELTRSVDALIRELNAAEKAKEWAEI